ncbi:MAG: hypothetical protein N2235_21325 [Fischerella sp.]|nr:hypothetical protein [Fischerella sp.]
MLTEPAEKHQLFWNAFIEAPKSIKFIPFSHLEVTVDESGDRPTVVIVVSLSACMEYGVAIVRAKLSSI